MNLPMTTAYSEQSVGDAGVFGLELRINESGVPLSDDTLNVIRDAADKIKFAIMAERIKQDPVAQQIAMTQREELLALFGDEKIYVEDLPNRYCCRYCCTHLPWFRVTTPIGPIVIGWRNHVINIDWSECRINATGQDVARGDDVTTGESYIHAANYAQARMYLTRLRAWKPITQGGNACHEDATAAK